MEIRALIEKNGWNKVVAFQTRNPMHRAHEELVRIAMEREGADGAVIHMLLGKLKKGDIVMTSTFGAGFTWGAVRNVYLFIEYQYSPRA